MPISLMLPQQANDLFTQCPQKPARSHHQPHPTIASLAKLGETKQQKANSTRIFLVCDYTTRMAIIDLPTYLQGYYINACYANTAITLCCSVAMYCPLIVSIPTYPTQVGNCVLNLLEQLNQSMLDTERLFGCKKSIASYLVGCTRIMHLICILPSSLQKLNSLEFL